MSYDIHYATFMEQLSSCIDHREVVLEDGGGACERMVREDAKELNSNEEKCINTITETENVACNLFMIVVT